MKRNEINPNRQLALIWVSYVKLKIQEERKYTNVHDVETERGSDELKNKEIQRKREGQKET